MKVLSIRSKVVLSPSAGNRGPASLFVVLCGTISLGAIGSVSAAPAASQASGFMRIYPVNRKVSDFPEGADLSTPETAYAAINRIMARGEEGKWRQVSTTANASRLPPADAPQRKIDPRVAATWLEARVLEVRVFQERHAAVIARIALPSGKVRFDLRSVTLENRRWLNEGQGIFDSLTGARGAFARRFADQAGEPRRREITDPALHLARFVEFLTARAEEPQAFVMKTLAAHKLVIMGEIHHRPRYWAFNTSLVSDPAFAKVVGTIYMELPSNDQTLIDGFLATDTLDAEPVIQMLRDLFETGWPDQAMLDFFVKVWRTNQQLPVNRKLRIVLADMQRPWYRINDRDDWQKYDVDRDRYMADMILADLRKHPEEKRHALFIVGVGHAMLNLRYFEGTPATSAGYHLADRLGRDKVFAFFQHTCRMSNMGRVDGRLCRGLFESAFAELGNKPMAFPLNEGPFGQEPFDALLERPLSGKYRDGYDAYLYLGPLEDEIFSPLIPGFYTDQFLQEVQRRHRLMHGRGWDQIYGRPLTVRSFTEWMKEDWGQKRRKWQPENLGPVDTWTGDADRE